MISELRFQISDLRFQISDSRVRICGGLGLASRPRSGPGGSPDDFRIKISDFRFEISDSSFQISDFRFHISDFGFQDSGKPCKYCYFCMFFAENLVNTVVFAFFCRKHCKYCCFCMFFAENLVNIAVFACFLQKPCRGNPRLACWGNPPGRSTAPAL